MPIYGPSTAPMGTDMDGNPFAGPMAALISKGDMDDVDGMPLEGPPAPVVAQFISPDPDEDVLEKTG